MSKNQGIGLILGFIVGFFNWISFSGYIERTLYLTKQQELIAVWTICIMFMLLFYFLNNLKKIIFLTIIFILFPIIFLKIYDEIQIRKILYGEEYQRNIS